MHNDFWGQDRCNAGRRRAKVPLLKVDGREEGSLLICGRILLAGS